MTKEEAFPIFAALCEDYGFVRPKSADSAFYDHYELCSRIKANVAGYKIFPQDLEALSITGTII